MEPDLANSQPSPECRYLPLGTFFWNLGASQDDSQRQIPTEWTRLSHDFIRQAVPEWTKELVQLVSSGWIQVDGRIEGIVPEISLALHVYVLPDDVGRGHVERSAGKMRSCLRTVLRNINGSPRAWEHPAKYHNEFLRYESVVSEGDSLFYIFNTLPSPQPSPDHVEDDLAAAAMQDLLDGCITGNGLKTTLYEYQRRSAAMMIQRETQPALELDQRLETWIGPTGEEFYLDRDKCEILSEKRLYHSVRGGILAETMGYGKTLICLAVILATRGYLPEVPPERQATFPDHSIRSIPLSLTEMCARNIAENNLQWRAYFHDQAKQGKHYTHCIKFLESTVSRYAVEIIKRRSRRDTKQSPELETAYIAPTTLVIVPPNLLEQWRREIHQHLRLDALSILVLDHSQKPMPPGENLRSYDMVLISGPRFEEELFPLGNDPFDIKISAGCTCNNVAKRRHCSVHPYRSPLRDIHLLRIIVDEGQRFVSASTTQAIQGLRAIKVERKWIMSGTPAGSLVGAEVEIAAEESLDDTRVWVNGFENGESDSKPSSQSKFQQNLAGRRSANDPKEERKSIDRLGHIAKSFLGVQPWANEEDAASWNTYVLPRKDGERKPLSLRNVLANLVVRHQYEDIVSNLHLPPLDNKLVYLTPCYHDKLSINLFILSLVSNAVTSERKDQDYMFDPRNRKHLETLIKNLRHAGFAWSGFVPDDIESACNFSRKHLENPEKMISEEDRANLQASLAFGDLALQSPVWKAFHERGEVGLYVSNFPCAQEKSWAFSSLVEGSGEPLLMSPTQLHDAQDVVETHLYASTFAEIVRRLESGWQDNASKALKPANTSTSDSSKKAAPTSKGVPQSGLQETKKITGSQFLSMNSASGKSRQLIGNSVAGSFVSRLGSTVTSPSLIHNSNDNEYQNAQSGNITNLKSIPTNDASSNDFQSSKHSSLKSILKTNDRNPEIPQTYPALSRTQLVGTSSAKLSYLIDKIIILHRQEKILVFYEGDDIAYYCAQALELLGIPHLIYAAGIAQYLRNDYQTLFNSDEHYRVLLMDLKQAALGLHMASASRVFFINPVWQPSIEAQAIKRAHRIGQTKPVYVETLVLKDTMEDAMLQRRKDMTVAEHQKAARSLLDDNHMKNIIQQTKLLAIHPDEIDQPTKQYAPLQHPQQVFARSILNAYGSKDAVLQAWRCRCETSDEEDHVNNYANDEASIENIANAHPDIVAQLHAAIKSSRESSKKRKIIFVDELEMRKAPKEGVKGFSGMQRFAGIKKAPVKKRHNLRKVHFADEQDVKMTGA